MSKPTIRIAGVTAAALTTLSLMAALHGYAAGIQRSAAQEVVQFEPVMVVGARLAKEAADPHIGEI